MSSFTYIHVDLNPTIGVLQIGSLIGVFLFGVVSVQTYNYYAMYKEDGWVNKALVASIWFLEAAHTLGISYEVYHSTITLYGEPEKLVKFEAIGAVVVFGGAVTLLAQAFFAIRLSKLFPGSYKYIGAACTGVSTVRFIATIYLTVTGVTARSFEEYRDTYGWLITTTFVVGAAVDIIIAGSMMYYLSRKRGKAMERLNARNEMRQEILQNDLFARAKTTGQDSNTVFSHDQPFEMVHPRQRISGDASLYMDKTKLKPANLGVYRISEEEAAAV
ncbi:hypothetical protein JR316_0009819 [Psilocybe cubensis]|uniref:Uncharacterized protein n=1 Tax=Psilocybe cubensis TaxID=181762 RepID=A0ACB8GQF4_PSICU|nr:hypothetical protein JR316_0009819 [Psilocybe cubensis]KAH9477597.1 hypothetical protein JR316_0009819 [Psilocybe cubensis]